MPRIALVTGSNPTFGLETCRNLTVRVDTVPPTSPTGAFWSVEQELPW